MEDIIGFFTDVNKAELRDRIVDESNDNEVSVNEEETVIDETKIDDDVDNIPLAAVLDNTKTLLLMIILIYIIIASGEKGTLFMVIMHLYNRSVTHKIKKKSIAIFYRIHY